MFSVVFQFFTLNCFLLPTSSSNIGFSNKDMECFKMSLNMEHNKFLSVILPVLFGRKVSNRKTFKFFSEDLKSSSL
jgi:hypothetical protein